ncbi:pantoate--beta-alanine ligase [Paenisporosarcina cavernae]|uniref:Pantothenate synthetase n=1 Tax=Paenisporosarcina cavernae TaxID=2320858 RepID=A0A385YSX5_9BACL|nr:pantoate--beta-alanine ligase [Paenisporosarcina cavernae]AYC29410.1 pantoate--beta-alanine ligase [Paenisporosarcina cavernae]
MITVHTIAALKEQLAIFRSTTQSIGFVPTMGYLHEGHESLLKKARNENDVVVLSIFVNPSQFGPNEDLDRYPRDLERDLAIAKKSQVDIVFAPSIEEMYPTKMKIHFLAEEQSKVLCGASRPGHFEGVLMVVTKLFHLVSPTRAYFGMKDAQQLAIIETLVRDYNFPLEIIRGETIREEDGLAKSSRNVFLCEKEREEAPALFQALVLAKEHFQKHRSVIDAIQKATEHVTKNTNAKIDYLQLLEYPSLAEVTEDSQEMIVAGAIYFENARLIDNQIFNVKGE